MSRNVIAMIALHFLVACAYLPANPNYAGPVARPAEIDNYYSKGHSYYDFDEKITRRTGDYVQKRIVIETDLGLITVDYFEKPDLDQDLVFVFPVLGGKNVIAEHFADYFAKHGLDSAIVNRVNDFKDPANFDKLEEIFRNSVIRDRIAIDFFEREYQKKNFATFGISRGAMNVALSAGVDPRLKYNVMALGGTDLVDIFKRSSQQRIRDYTKTVMAAKGITAEQFYDLLRERLKTDPKYLAQYIDSRDSLLMFGLFDRTVPFTAGLRLRTQMGDPQTVVLYTDHFTSLLMTQYLKLLPPLEPFSIFPPDYVESEALNFYRRSFGRSNFAPRLWLTRILQVPFDIITKFIVAWKTPKAEK